MGKSSDTWKVDRHMAEIIREILHSIGLTHYDFSTVCKVAKIQYHCF